MNTASRMESYGEAGKVNISQATFTVVEKESELQFEHRGDISVKQGLFTHVFCDEQEGRSPGVIRKARTR